ncbi:MAG: hypothetical protein LBB88_01245 [Planctomycetaceae bacterium]|jgi:hypothetical protein|nr:hypothetical protein [Planctomycetaceae bacterium]
MSINLIVQKTICTNIQIKFIAVEIQLTFEGVARTYLTLLLNCFVRPAAKQNLIVDWLNVTRLLPTKNQ